VGTKDKCEEEGIIPLEGGGSSSNSPRGGGKRKREKSVDQNWATLHTQEN